MSSSLSVVSSAGQSMPMVSWEEEMQHPGVILQGVLQKAAYIIYKSTGCEDAQRNWYGASSAFLNDYAQRFNGFTQDKSLEKNLEERLNYQAYKFYKVRSRDEVTGNSVVTDEQFAQYDWEKSVDRVARDIYGTYLDSLK